MAFRKKNYIQWEQLKNQDQNGNVLVNTNRILWLLSVVLGNQELDAVRVITEIVDEICENKKMYITMKVGDVINCFENHVDQLPLNTFKDVSESKNSN